MTEILTYTALILLLGIMAVFAIGPLIIDESIDDDILGDKHND